jgi:glutaredoxin 3
MDIIVYVKTGCPWCIGVTEFLDAAGIDYETRNVTENPAFMQEMEALSGQSKAPTLDIEGEILADTDKEAVEAYLKEKGVL